LLYVGQISSAVKPEILFHEWTRMNTNIEQVRGSEVILKDLSFQIMAAVFEVHNILGPGFLENVYEKALLTELHLRGIKAEAQKPVQVMYKGKEVGSYYPDIIVNDEVIMELKAIDKLIPLHEAQVLNYLKATGMKLGLLVNFGREKVEFKRLVL
jgi:GxxExxY protein